MKARRFTLAVGMALTTGCVTQPAKDPAAMSEPAVTEPPTQALEPSTAATVEDDRSAELVVGTEVKHPRLRGVVVRGEPLRVTGGAGRPFDEAAERRYRAMLRRVREDGRVQWIVSDLRDDAVVATSLDPDRLFYGASVAKLFVAGAVAARLAERAEPDTLESLAAMLVVSDNPAWKKLQDGLGGGTRSAGQAAVQAFAASIGIERSRVFDGWRDTEHGNELTARDVARFLGATYRGAYQGAELVWALMQAIRTGQERGRAHLPTSLAVGGKTGSFRGPSIDVATRRPAVVDVRHDAMTLSWGGRPLALVVFAEQASEEDVAALAGGIFRDVVVAGVGAGSH